MYTVVRVGSTTLADDVSDAIVRMLTEFGVSSPGPGVRNPHFVNGELCTSSDWVLHRDAIIAFLRRWSAAGCDHIYAELDIEFDVAVYPEDRSGLLAKCLCIDNALIGELHQTHSNIMISVYNDVDENE
ncbi:MAG: hypothetical protein L6Q93_16200 [Phycisphaerae bacterium]|nr:hypothetical protein [Phycisphaerae bacterium]NUQ10356.1 hypothetical protein [Phycisphaerae bacterium]